MNKRTDYEHQELDLDGFYYFFKNNDVEYAWHCENKDIQDFAEWFRLEENKYSETSLYHKGTALYFTFENKKFYVSWVFYDDDLIKKAIDKLKLLGATNLQLNYGELD